MVGRTSALARVAADAELLVVARVLQGGFAALMVPQVLLSLAALYAPRERAAVLGLIGGIGGMAAVIGPVLGGLLVTTNALGIGWRSVFLINVPVGLALVALAIAFVPNTRAAHPLRLDLTGVLLSAAGLLLVLVPLVEGRRLGWPAWLWLAIAAGVVVLVLFLRHQHRRMRADGSALLPLRLFARRGFSAGVVTQGAFQGAMNSFTVVLLIYLQTTLGFSALGAGLTLLSFSVGAFIGTGIAVPLGAKVGKTMITAGALVQATGVLWAFSVIASRGAALNGWDLALPLAVTGVGLGLLIVPLTDVAFADVAVADAGAASGTFSTFQQLGAAVGVAISATVFFGRTGSDVRPAVVLDALGASTWIAVAAYLLAAAASVLLPSRAAVRRHLAEADAASGGGAGQETPIPVSAETGERSTATRS